MEGLKKVNVLFLNYINVCSGLMVGSKLNGLHLYHLRDI